MGLEILKPELPSPLQGLLNPAFGDPPLEFSRCRGLGVSTLTSFLVMLPLLAQGPHTESHQGIIPLLSVPLCPHDELCKGEAGASLLKTKEALSQF
jgi:hypothetical protein